jgi:hypothetical protein
VLVIENGASLRGYLSRVLNCDPMRISKKFTGVKCLGKVHVFDEIVHIVLAWTQN